MRLLLIVILSALVYNCSPEPRIPKGILPPQEMEILLFDMLRTDEYLNLYVVNDSLNLRRKNFYQKVLQIHKVSKQDFQKSFSFYQAHPNMLKVILDSLHGKLKPVVAEKTNDSLKLH